MGVPQGASFSPGYICGHHQTDCVSCLRHQSANHTRNANWIIQTPCLYATYKLGIFYWMRIVWNITVWVYSFRGYLGCHNLLWYQGRRSWSPLTTLSVQWPSSFCKRCPSLQWHHNDHDGVSNHQPHGCLLNRLFRRRSKKTSKLRVTGLYVGNSPGPGNSPHKGPVTRKMFPFDDVIMDFTYSTAGIRFEPTLD